MELKFIARKKNYDHILLLVSGPDFKRDVMILRHNLAIPPQGFKTDTDYDTWMVRIACDYTKTFKEGLWSSSAFMRFINAPRLLSEHHHLPENYHRYIKEYILYNTVRAPLNNFEITPSAPTGHALIKVYANP